MIRVLFDYFPVIPALIGLLVFCLVPFEEPKLDETRPEAIRIRRIDQCHNFPVHELKRESWPEPRCDWQISQVVQDACMSLLFGVQGREAALVAVGAGKGRNMLGLRPAHGCAMGYAMR